MNAETEFSSPFSDCMTKMSADLPPGDYALNLFLQDQVSGKVIELLEPFRLSPVAGPQRAPTGSR